MEIRINQIGRIIAGVDIGRYVKVENDSASMGGFLVITSATLNFNGCFDDWVQDLEALERYVRESRWSVQWL